MGCSSSIHGISNTQPVSESVKQLKRSTQESIPFATTNFVENIILVWLTNQTLASRPVYGAQLRHVVSSLRIFDDVDDCYTFVSGIQDEIIFLVVSADPKQSISQIHHFPQIYKIYIFNLASQTNLHETHDGFPKADTFQDINSLCDQLVEDRKLVEHDSLFIATVNPSISNSDPMKRRTAEFLAIQMIRATAIRYKFANDSKDIFADFCREIYAYDEEELKNIDDFNRNYRAQDALKWFIKPCFVSRILNRLQRLLETDLIYKTGFLTKHMHFQLVSFYENMNLLFGNTPLTLYRGKTMPQNEFNSVIEDLSGSLLSSAAFLTANTNKCLTIDLLNRIITNHPERIAVLFEIHIDPTVHRTNPFALLRNTNNGTESHCDEFCFTFSTVFRVESLEKNGDLANSLWIVKMVPVDEDDPQLFELLKPLRSAEVYENPTSFFSKLLMDAGYLHSVEKYCFRLLLDKSIVDQPRRLARIYHTLGNILSAKNKFNDAIEYYEKALNTSLSVLKLDHHELISFYNALADCYSKNKMYDLALQKYERASEIIQHNIQSVDQKTMEDLNNRINETKNLLQEHS